MNHGRLWVLWLVWGCASAGAGAPGPAAQPTPVRAAASARDAQKPAQPAVAVYSVSVQPPEQAAREVAMERVRRAEPLVVAASPAAPASAPKNALRCGRWPHWERFAEAFIEDDGRVVDHTADGRSTSEGQAYALFFSLVAGDRARFDSILRWTQDNLAKGSLATSLPAWLWGLAPGGKYRVLDQNPASDADLWLAYVLLEASRLWGLPAHAELAARISAQVLQQETRDVPGLGPVLLPGKFGFVAQDGTVRLNPSYPVVPQLRRLAHMPAGAAYKPLLSSAVRMWTDGMPTALAPDWLAYKPHDGFIEDSEHGPTGSYDAIRVYLWLALLPDDDPLRAQLQPILSRFLRLVERSAGVPEKVQVQSGEASLQQGPPGFWAVARAAAVAQGRRRLANTLALAVDRSEHDGLFGDPPAYYDQMLILFAYGFLESRYAFTAEGRLQVGWEVEPCLE